MLARAFAGDGHDVVVLSRSGDAPAGPASAVAWGGRTLGPWAEEIDGADVVINLAGRSVNCRYTPANRRAIADSRVDSTRVAGEAIAQAARPPSVWLQSSTATIYAHRFDAPNDERSGILGGDEARAPDAWRFSIDLARAWERALEGTHRAADDEAHARSRHRPHAHRVRTDPQEPPRRPRAPARPRLLV